MSKRRRGSSARELKRAQRARGPQHAPVKPGLSGGRYQPLNEQELQRIHQAALDVLARVGMGESIPLLVELATAKGCHVNEQGRLCFRRGTVNLVGQDNIGENGAANKFHLP